MTLGPRDFSPPLSWLIVLCLWALCSAAMIWASWHFIAPMNFRDPDDALRLVQVRELLAGQSWFDLTQYRIHPPSGTPMHWSRIVDLPIAFVIATMTPLFGTGEAERIALIVVPLTLLLALFVIVQLICKQLGLQRRVGLLASAMLATSLPILIQFAPMRIDHHGWQILLGGVGLYGLMRAAHGWCHGGLIAGLAFAGWMQVSIEGLPYAVAAGAVLGVRTILCERSWPELRDYMLSLTAGSAILLFSTHAPADALIFWCDAMSPGFLAPLALATGGLLSARALLPFKTPGQRIAPLAVGAAAGLAGFLLLSRQCLAGPFETLDPIVYQLWYRAVLEGLPIAAQKPDLQAMIILPSLIGLFGAGAAAWSADHPARRAAWASLLAMQIAAFFVSIDVMRAMGFAHLTALPGNAWLLAVLMGKAQRLRTMTLRVALTAGTIVMTPFGAASATAAAIDDAKNVGASATTDEIPDRFQCTTWKTLRGLDALPRATLFTPLDIGAHMLVYTHHDVVATGHHRNAEGMKSVLEGLLARPDAAHALVRKTGARYLVYCAGENEVAKYAKLRPDSLIAHLMSGDVPKWLTPVAMRTGETVKVFRIG